MRIVLNVTDFTTGEKVSVYVVISQLLVKPFCNKFDFVLVDRAIRFLLDPGNLFATNGSFHV